MASAEHTELPQNATEYVSHHLTNLTFGKIDGNWAFAHSPEEAAEMGFWAINVDSMLMSILFGVLFAGLFKFVIARMSADPPRGKSLQNVIEMTVEMVQNSIKSSFHARNEMIGPMAMTIFVWILMMNAMDLVPVDWIPLLAQTVMGDSHAYFRAVPTTDLNITLGFAVSVFFLIIFYSVKVKGLGGFLGEFAFQPFGKYAIPLNLLLELPGFLAKPVSLALRLYGNFFAGETIFLVIALLGYWQLPLHFGWAFFHILVVVLQAY